MRDDYDLFAIGDTHLADKRLIVVTLPLGAIFLWVEGLRAPSVTESIRNDEANASIRPSFHLVSPSITSRTISRCCSAIWSEQVLTPSPESRAGGAR
jgi:hypothetical protein